MAVKFRAHFDGKAIVPDEPTNLAPGTSGVVQFSVTTASPKPTRAQRLAALRRLAAMALPGLNISSEALRRENLYEDR
jgi:hypothetical protein